MPKVTRRRLEVVLAVTFLLAMLLGAGPGTLLVNTPRTWFGVPQLYVWGSFWCTVEALVVLAAFLLVWHGDSDSDPTERLEELPPNSASGASNAER